MNDASSRGITLEPERGDEYNAVVLLCEEGNGTCLRLILEPELYGRVHEVVAYPLFAPLLTKEGSGEVLANIP